MVEEALDKTQKTGAILKTEQSDLRKRDKLALEKVKALEKKYAGKMLTVNLGFCTLKTTKKKSDFEVYDPMRLINYPSQ